MKLILGTWLVALAVISGGVNQGRGEFQSASKHDMNTAIGGACFDCLGLTEDPACKPGFLPACQQKTGFCLKHTFTSLKVNYCKTVADGTGYKGCNAYTPQVCVRIKTCTTCTPAASECTNCGPETTEDKPTECSIIPYAPCTPPS